MKGRLRFLFLIVLAAAATAALGVRRYHGDWEISRGAKGQMALEIFDDGRIQGSCTDSGWEKMTGDRRTGRVTGRFYQSNGTMTISWSTGQTQEFRGRIRAQDTVLIFNGDRYVNGKRDADTYIITHLDLNGWGQQDPTGNWQGHFTYGPYKGTSYIRVRGDDTFSGHMYGDKGQDWTVTGSFNTNNRSIRITVNSGASKQTYSGSYSSLSDGQIRVTFRRPEGDFVATMKKTSS
jgi:hypothetical protein